MSVIMTMIFDGDAAAVERYAAENPEKMRAIVDHAVEHGLIAHRFYATDDGKLMVLDEWPDAESFQHFFGHVAGQVAPIMAAAGVTSEPNPMFWRKLESQDEYGWNG